MADASLLSVEGVRLGCAATDRFDAVRQAGAVLVSVGAVEPSYVEAMQERERSLSSYVGEGFALPHGTDESRRLVRRASLAFLQFPDGVDWEGSDVRACVAIAAAADEHMAVMSSLARVLLDPLQAEDLRTASGPERVLALLAPEDAGAHEQEAV